MSVMQFCSLYSGSSGNSLYVSAGDTKVLVDAGLSCKRICEALSSIGENPGEISAILITHEHSDHTRGAGIFSRKFGVPIYANENTWSKMIRDLGKVLPENVRFFKSNESFHLGDLEIHPFSTPHDAAEPVGFNFFAFDKKLTIATDLGHMNEELLKHIAGSDLVMLESNHDLEMLKIGPYPYHLKKRILGSHGHLSNDTASEVLSYLVDHGTSRFILGHLSHENNYPELAFLTAKNIIQAKNMVVGEDILLEIARRDQVGHLVVV